MIGDKQRPTFGMLIVLAVICAGCSTDSASRVAGAHWHRNSGVNGGCLVADMGRIMACAYNNVGGSCSIAVYHLQIDLGDFKTCAVAEIAIEQFFIHHPQPTAGEIGEPIPSR